MKNFSILFLIFFLFGCNETLHEEPGLLLNENSFVSERIEACNCQAQFQNNNNFGVFYGGSIGVNTSIPQTNGFDTFTGTQFLRPYETSIIFSFNAENPLANGNLNEFLLDNITTTSEAYCLSFKIALSCDGSPLKFKSVIVPNSVNLPGETTRFAKFTSEGSCETKIFSHATCYQLPNDDSPSDNPNCEVCLGLAFD